MKQPYGDVVWVMEQESLGKFFLYYTLYLFLRFEHLYSLTRKLAEKSWIAIFFIP